MIFWYYCYGCGCKFSWVFDGLSEPKKCIKCTSKKIERIKNISWKKIKKEL